MNTHSLTESLVKKYHTRNPFEILKEKNFILIYAPLVDVMGFHQYFQRNHIIYIDKNLSEHDKIFVCAHELGHMLMHKKANTVYMDTKTYFNTNKYEIEANTFATELLIPDEILQKNSTLTTEQLSRLLGYEQALIELRLKSYREVQIWFSKERRNALWKRNYIWWLLHSL